MPWLSTGQCSNQDKVQGWQCVFLPADSRHGKLHMATQSAAGLGAAVQGAAQVARTLNTRIMSAPCPGAWRRRTGSRPGGCQNPKYTYYERTVPWVMAPPYSEPPRSQKPKSRNERTVPWGLAPPYREPPSLLKP